MKNLKSFLLLVALFFATSFVMAQTATDFQGSWLGTDKAGNSVELKLNADYSCILKLNGSAAFNITGYKFMRGGAQAPFDEIAQDKEIWLYTSTAPSASNISLSSPTVIKYEGTARLNDAAYKSLTISFDLNTGSASQNITYDLTR